MRKVELTGELRANFSVRIEISDTDYEQYQQIVNRADLSPCQVDKELFALTQKYHLTELKNIDYDDHDLDEIEIRLLG